MAFIGYSAAGYTELASEINSRKERLLDVLNSFTEVETAISECWKGEDADAYSEELKRVIESTKTSVSEAYDALGNQCRTTYEDWVNKQSMN